MPRPPEYGSEKAARMIALLREHLTLAELRDLIATRHEPWERDWYAAYVHDKPVLAPASWLRAAIEAYLDPGPDPKGHSAYIEDILAHAPNPLPGAGQHAQKEMP